MNYKVNAADSEKYAIEAENKFRAINAAQYEAGYAAAKMEDADKLKQKDAEIVEMDKRIIELDYALIEKYKALVEKYTYELEKDKIKLEIDTAKQELNILKLEIAIDPSKNNKYFKDTMIEPLKAKIAELESSIK